MVISGKWRKHGWGLERKGSERQAMKLDMSSGRILSQVLLSIYYTPGTLLHGKEPPADQRPFLLSTSFILAMETDRNRKSKQRYSHSLRAVKLRNYGVTLKAVPWQRGRTLWRGDISAKTRTKGSQPWEDQWRPWGRNDRDPLGTQRSVEAHHGRPCGPC